MNRPWAGTGAGWILALLVLILVVIAFVFSTAMPPWLPLVLIGMLALAMLI